MLKLETYRGAYIDLSGLSWTHIDKERSQIGLRYPFRTTRIIYRVGMFLPPSVEEVERRKRERESLRKGNQENTMSLPYAPNCALRFCSADLHLAEGVIISPTGTNCGAMCRKCAKICIDEYREKLGEVWTFEEREYERIDTNRSPYVYDSPGVAASTLGRLGGLAKSEAKSTSSRANGRKGGRPKSTQSIDIGDI